MKNAAKTMEDVLVGPLTAIGQKMQDVGKGMTLAITAPLTALAAVSLTTFDNSR